MQVATSVIVVLGKTAEDFVDTLCQQDLGTGKGNYACVRRQLCIL